MYNQTLHEICFFKSMLGKTFIAAAIAKGRVQFLFLKSKHSFIINVLNFQYIFEDVKQNKLHQQNTP